MQPTTPKRRQRIIEHCKAWSWLTPSLIGVLVFFIIPFCVVIYYSVLDNPIFANFVGLDNFIKLFSNLLGSDFPGVHVVQRVCIPAWLDGDGVKYTKAD